MLAAWAVKTAAVNDDTAMDVITITEIKADSLRNVYWDMNSLDYFLTKESETFESDDEEGDPETFTTVTLTITQSGKEWEDMPEFYGFSDDQTEILPELMTTPEYYSMLQDIAGSLEMSSALGKEILNNLPDDISAERKEVVRSALTLVGKVNYFWGGKSFAFGWDDRWGQIRKVTAEGSENTGSYRAFGLDCSGFTGWSFINGFNDTSVFYDLGFTAAEQYNNSVPVSFGNAKPGDLAFWDDLSHVGVIVGYTDDGADLLIVHCEGGSSNVIISEFISYGFYSVGRPSLYND